MILVCYDIFQYANKNSFSISKCTEGRAAHVYIEGASHRNNNAVYKLRVESWQCAEGRAVHVYIEGASHRNHANSCKNVPKLNHPN